MKFRLAMTAAAFLASSAVNADEGMWQPHQLKDISKELKSMGLKINPKKMQNLTQFPMNAIISLGGCTASFVSPKGLVVTNHHCAYGSIQYNSTEDNDLIKKGFVAKSFDQELAAAPGSRVYVTESLDEVTDKILGGIDSKLAGAEYYNEIESRKKKLISECEVSKDYRCEVYSYYGGKDFYLIKQLAIRDVRLAYAPPSSIGKFGGDTDNWMWPRHTGDWAFYRAYVGKDGKPADYSEDNVPFEPKSFLKVNKKSVDENDFVMVLGYPGRTNRYRTAIEVDNQFNNVYPMLKKYREAFSDEIIATAEEGSDARIKYQSLLAGLANATKNYGSMLDSYHKGDLLEKRQATEAELTKWINKKSARKKQYGPAVENMEKLVKKSIANQERDIILGHLNFTNMISVSQRLYRLANEKQKPDAERERGYQERDMTRLKERLQRVNRRYDGAVDTAVITRLVSLYAELPKSERVKDLDKALGIDKKFDERKLKDRIAKMHKNTKLGDEKVRLAWMDKSVEDFKKSDDPFIQFAVAMYDYNMAKEKKDKDLKGDFQKARSSYMEAIIALKTSQDKAVYPDANSSLRISYGSVKGYSPKDGIYSTPFTTLQGMKAKYVKGDDEFDLNDTMLKAIDKENRGEYFDKKLGSVPVNFLSTLDTTGGNSGSPTLNGEGELVGLLFDGVYESIIGDWDYNPKLNRSIQVSSAYMLWTMEHVDGAQNLIKEMVVVD